MQVPRDKKGSCVRDSEGQFYASRGGGAKEKRSQRGWELGQEKRASSQRTQEALEYMYGVRLFRLRGHCASKAPIFTAVTHEKSSSRSRRKSSDSARSVVDRSVRSHLRQLLVQVHEKR
jgi:hypothetical protein